MAGLTARLAAGERLLADGATGTQLQARGLPEGHCPELWNVENPDAVGAVAADYAAAGSDLVYTNSFGGSVWRLDMHGAADRLEELNEAAARVAKAAVGDTALVVGSMGPSGQFLEPLGLLTADDCAASYARQAAALAAGGADALVLETFYGLDELEAALRGVKSACDLPVICSLTYGSAVRTMAGVAPADAAKALVAAGADVLGLNCGDDIDVVPKVLAAYLDAAPGTPCLMKPNAGLPVTTGGQLTWPMGPDEFADLARGWLQAGARLLGGCCGTTPAHITALRRVIDEA